MDPHKRSATIEVMAGDETVVGAGRFDTGRGGYAAMRKYAMQWPNRVWAIEGCQGIGRHIANRLLADGEQVVDVPPKLSARARVFATGQGRKTDATDAHSVALVGTRMAGLRPVVNDEQLALLRILVDRRRSLGEDHTRMVSQLHQLLLELIPGGAKNNRAHFASWNGTAPIDASSGEQVRHRLSRAGNRQINRVLHIMATVQLRNPTEGRAYFDRKKASGKTSMEAMRALKRRLSDIVYRRMINDAAAAVAAGPGGHRGTTTDSSVTNSHPQAGSSEKSLPGPAATQLRTPLATVS
ncbi:IS110 family transposase [Micromonospora palomenae]